MLLLLALEVSPADALTLAWDPSPSPDVAGYEVHVGFAPGTYEYSIDVGTETRLPMPALAAGRVHYFVVAAYDDERRRSAFSNEIAVPREIGDALPLAAGFDVIAATGAAPHVVRFSPDVSGAVLSFRWDFGDGESFVSDSVAPLPDIAHVYEQPGAYSVTFTVAGPGGMRARHRVAIVRVVDARNSDGCPCSFWGAAVPSVADDGSQAPINVGMRFTTARDGYVTAIRFYKGAANLGPHVGDLWTEQGQRLASVAFAGESTSGWQQADFAVPVAVRKGSGYVVSYHAPVGRVAKDPGAFLKNVASGPLHAPGSRASAANGTHALGPPGTFPNRSDKQSNYWVDVVFVPAD